MSTLPSLLAAAAPGASHHDPVQGLALYLAVILLAARAGGALAARLGQPAVLGELVAGIVLGNLHLLGLHGLEPLRTDTTLDSLARLGVLLLLFEVGLESTLQQMRQVGAVSALVATIGVVAPFALGWAVGAWLLPGASGLVHAFLGATLCATSVGITARVLQDLGHSKGREARIILGAAVLDDVLGLLVLAVVTGVIGAADRGVPFSAGELGGTVAKALGFLLAAVLLGPALSRALFRQAARLRLRGTLLAAALVLCFGLSWLAGLVGLAPIIGAFAAGLVLEEEHYRLFEAHGEPPLEALVTPLTGFLAPVFFVLTGVHTELAAFTRPGVLLLAVALTLAAIVGKQACALGVPGPAARRLTVGLGMVPRGEVGLVFASLGQNLTLAGAPVFTEETFSAVVIMVVLTTLVTPPALKWSLGRKGRAQAA